MHAHKCPLETDNTRVFKEKKKWLPETQPELEFISSLPETRTELKCDWFFFFFFSSSLTETRTVVLNFCTILASCSAYAWSALCRSFRNSWRCSHERKGRKVRIKWRRKKVISQKKKMAAIEISKKKKQNRTERSSQLSCLHLCEDGQFILQVVLHAFACFIAYTRAEARHVDGPASACLW